jgi:hypothetical protein
MIPEMFSDWDTVEAEKSRQVWHMLSLGPTRTGESLLYFLIPLFLVFFFRTSFSQSW